MDNNRITEYGHHHEHAHSEHHHDHSGHVTPEILAQLEDKSDEAKQAKAEYDHRVEVARIEAAQQRARTAQACGYAITSEDAALINKGGQMIADVISAGAKQGDSI